jgi:hypothetical protein
MHCKRVKFSRTGIRQTHKKPIQGSGRETYSPIIMPQDSNFHAPGMVFDETMTCSDLTSSLERNRGPQIPCTSTTNLSSKPIHDHLGSTFHTFQIFIAALQPSAGILHSPALCKLEGFSVLTSSNPVSIKSWCLQGYQIRRSKTDDRPI